MLRPRGNPPPARSRAPLVGGSDLIANIECARMEDNKMVAKYSVWVLRPVKGRISSDKRPGQGRKMCHHRGDGTFVVDGDILDTKEMIAERHEFQD